MFSCQVQSQRSFCDLKSDRITTFFKTFNPAIKYRLGHSVTYGWELEQARRRKKKEKKILHHKLLVHGNFLCSFIYYKRIIICTYNNRKWPFAVPHWSSKDMNILSIWTEQCLKSKSIVLCSTTALKSPAMLCLNSFTRSCSFTLSLCIASESSIVATSFLL